MNAYLRLRPFVLFVLLIILSLLVTSMFANAGTAYSADQPDDKHQPLDQPVETFASGRDIKVDGIEADNLSSAAADAKNVEFAGHIGGATFAVAVQGDYAYVGEGPSLTILDITNPADPGVVGEVYPLPDNMRDVAVSGNYAYVAVRDGLRIIDISNPTAPTEAGSVDTPGYAYGVAVDGNYAYVAVRYSGLRIINISNPSSPTEVGFYNTPGSARAVAVAGNYAYVADGSGGMLILRYTSYDLYLPVAAKAPD